MDPFSILAGAAGLADVSIRLINLLRDVRRQAKDIEEEIDDMVTEVESLKRTVERFKALYKFYVEPESGRADDGGKSEFWIDVKVNLDNMTKFVERLEEQVNVVCGTNPKPSGSWDATKKTWRKRDRALAMTNLRNKVKTHQDNLNGLVMMIHLQLTHDGLHTEREIRANLQKLTDEMHSHDAQNKSSHPSSNAPLQDASLAAQKSVADVLKSLLKLVKNPEINKYFEVPALLAKHYIGREEEQREMANSLLQPPPIGESQRHQRRFVVSGIPGSGKTQFCCKFADDYRQSFWAVISVNGQSQDTLRVELAQKVGTLANTGHEMNEKEALSWLSNREERWLLIIDNVDDPELDLSKFLPRGSRGHVLITTRTSIHRDWGNVGRGSFDFGELKEEDARALLLREAQAIEPWEPAVDNMARKISRTLGYLALAITQAGAAIRNGHCQLSEFLMYYDAERSRARTRNRRLSSSRERSRDGSEDRRRSDVDTTYEMSYQSLKQKALSGEDCTKYRDAIQLLHLFGFFGRSGIRLEYLQRAVDNIVNARALPPDAQDMSIYSWTEWARLVRYQAWGMIYRRKLHSLFPDIVRDGLRDGAFDILRARRAMQQLVDYAFVTQSSASRNLENWTFSFHNLGHKWAREMSDMDVTTQGRWLEAASGLLAACILLPPRAKKEDEELRRELMFHVDTVVSLRKELQPKIASSYVARLALWPMCEGDTDAERLVMYAKFAMIFAHNARWDAAETFLTKVRTPLMALAGYKLDKARSATAFVTKIYEYATRFDEMGDLLNDMTAACEEIFGEDHPHAMTAQLLLGQGRLRQGRATEAVAILEVAVDGLKKHKDYGLRHSTTLEAMDVLGDALRYLWTKSHVKRARKLHREVIKVWHEMGEGNSFAAVTARERLCFTSLVSKKQTHLEQALPMILEIIQYKEKTFGFDHRHTLYSRLIEADIRCELGQVDEAEGLYKIGLPSAANSIGSEHVGYLLGRAFLGKVYARQGRFTEARDLLLEVGELQDRFLEGLGRDHPDRISTLIILAEAYKGIGNYDDYARVADDVITRLRRIRKTAVDHPLAVKLRKEKQAWEADLAQQNLLNKVVAVDTTPLPLSSDDETSSDE